MNNKHKLLSALVMATTATVASAKMIEYMPDGYHLDTITTPKDVTMQIAGLDTNDLGDVYVATRLGEVWKYSNNQWFKFADGLHEPTGLLCDDDGSIVVGQKPELTRLVDLDNDGIADDYIRVANGWDFHDNYHEFNFAPVKDNKGNYYGTLNLGHGGAKKFSLGAMGSEGGYRGWAYKVDTNGKFSPFASGLRSPAGLGISPNDELFYTDNQGDWVATSKLHYLEENKFYGHPVSLINHPAIGSAQEVMKYTVEDFDKMREPATVWFPHVEIANSPGNPEWDTTEGQFGPFKGQMFVSDLTQSNVFRVLLEKVKGEYQGAAINFAGGLQSGNIRISFDKKGQLWVGQTTRGWGARGGKPFGLQKLSWDGTNPFEMLDINLTKTGFKLNFTEALSPSSVKKANLAVQEWHYRYHEKYGSPKIDEKSLPVSRITLSDDKKSLMVDMPLTAGKVVMIDFNGLMSQSDRKPSVTKVYYTLNNLLD